MCVSRDNSYLSRDNFKDKNLFLFVFFLASLNSDMLDCLILKIFNKTTARSLRDVKQALQKIKSCYQK